MLPSKRVIATLSLGPLFLLTLTLVTLLPPLTHAEALDPRYPGVWEQTHELPNGSYHLLYTVRPNGTYTLLFERPDRTFTDEGAIEATGGQWSARSDTGKTSSGRYEFPNEDTLVTTTFLGSSTWLRAHP